MYPSLNCFFHDAAHWGFWPDGSVVGPGVPPEHWAAAITTVRADVPFLQTGEEAYCWDDRDAVWNLFISADGMAAVEVRGPDGRAHIYTESSCHTVDADEPDTTVWVADLVQGDLAASQWVLWPAFDGQAPMDPLVLHGRAVWVHRHTREPIAPIGGLQGLVSGS
ncbi:hypothetical protein [Williamsia sp. M5A3_1d]